MSVRSRGGDDRSISSEEVAMNAWRSYIAADSYKPVPLPRMLPRNYSTNSQPFSPSLPGTAHLVMSTQVSPSQIILCGSRLKKKSPAN